MNGNADGPRRTAGVTGLSARGPDRPARISLAWRKAETATPRGPPGTGRPLTGPSNGELTVAASDRKWRGDYRARYWDIPSLGAPPAFCCSIAGSPPPAPPAPVLPAGVLPAPVLPACVLPAPVLPAPALSPAPPPAPWANAKVEPTAKNIANAMTGNFFMIELSVWRLIKSKFAPSFLCGRKNGGGLRVPGSTPGSLRPELNPASAIA